MTSAERLARVALSRLTEPGDPRFTKLVAELGGASLHGMLLRQEDSHGMLTDVAARLGSTDPERELDRADRLGIRFVIPSDPEWPSQLGDLMNAPELHQRGGPPIGLWVKGPWRLDQLGASVAVVGSRSSTTYGDQVSSEMGAVLVRHGAPVISGAAFGIDQAAHRGAIAMEGPTVAVLACGADRAYPAAHQSLIDHIAQHGAVVSEAPPGCAPTRIRFLARNRLIAALSRGTVVVEAAQRSGALNTASWAERLNRQVLAVPGPVTSAQSQGAHDLVRRGVATLVTNAHEVLEMVGGVGEHLLESPQEPLTVRDRLTLRHRQVLDAVPVAAGVGTDSVARTAGLGIVEVRSALVHLEKTGLVEQDGVGWRLGVLGRA
ncbi:DNA protecting protein DprA [Nocardioides psychrotolerans]|uniref:DNA processing protein n=1 Tax=Nocardioides psychrotolerans TaxID=1005945 RepID=A0A1I3CXL8_9ACTN|nr:DNA-processing protein DprA [Nocardioides psychrotolerans]GEP36941.1 DNA protecting protein DprA [Nocardioides psychrotolerans]SFH78999.1 DNA processing protein [Nocardioides psychrotolerans]